MSYSVLRNIRVIEVSLLAADVLGQHLADLGAEVIKIESPTQPDYVRYVGPASLGGPDGLSLHHLRWNRAKESVFLDLKQPEGKLVFLDLVRQADVVIEGLRAGALSALGLGYDVLRQTNPTIVFCSLSGMGSEGPYKELPTHGFLFDAFTGLAPPEYTEDPDQPRAPATEGGFIEYNAGGLFGAVAVLSGVIRALQTGEGCSIDIAQIDAIAYMEGEQLEKALNGEKIYRRSNYGDGQGIQNSVRSNYYKTSDQRVVLFQALERKFWENFCDAIGQPGLRTRFPEDRDYDLASGDEDLRRELETIFSTRTLTEWVQFFIEHNIPGGPVYEISELVEDQHYLARGNIASVNYDSLGEIKLVTTPIKFMNEQFDMRRAPTPGDTTRLVLARLLEFDDKRLDSLADCGVISKPRQSPD
jgi:crotonobetainyl-CoA:carnitine CoA-transferase CaiB-like acyl-CoA transferase